MTATLSTVPVTGTGPTAPGVACGHCSHGYGRDRVTVRHASVAAVKLCGTSGASVRRPSGTIVGAETQLPNGASVPVSTVVDILTASGAVNGSDVVNVRPYLPQVPGTVRPAHVSADGARLQETAMRRPDARPLSLLDVPAGRYAVRGADGVVKFYRVDRPTEGRWAGRVFVKIQAGDDLHDVRDSARRTGILSAILAAGPHASSVLYGHELGRCGVCGRTLTDPESIAAGIGPVCASRF